MAGVFVSRDENSFSNNLNLLSYPNITGTQQVTVPEKKAIKNKQTNKIKQNNLRKFVSCNKNLHPVMLQKYNQIQIGDNFFISDFQTLTTPLKSIKDTSLTTWSPSKATCRSNAIKSSSLEHVTSGESFHQPSGYQPGRIQTYFAP